MATEETDPQKLLAKMFEAHIAATLAAGVQNTTPSAAVTSYRAILKELRQDDSLYRALP